MTKDDVLARLTELGCSASDAQGEWLSWFLVDSEDVIAAFLKSESATVITSRSRLLHVDKEKYALNPSSSTFVLADIERLSITAFGKRYRIVIRGLGGSDNSYPGSEPTMTIDSAEKDSNSLFKFYQQLTEEFLIAKDARS